MLFFLLSRQWPPLTMPVGRMALGQIPTIKSNQPGCYPYRVLKHHLLAGVTEIRMLCVNIQVSSVSTD